jgi:hypothetical protein
MNAIRSLRELDARIPSRNRLGTLCRRISGDTFPWGHLRCAVTAGRRRRARPFRSRAVSAGQSSETTEETRMPPDGNIAATSCSVHRKFTPTRRNSAPGKRGLGEGARYQARFTLSRCVSGGRGVATLPAKFFRRGTCSGTARVPRPARPESISLLITRSPDFRNNSRRSGSTCGENPPGRHRGTQCAIFRDGRAGGTGEGEERGVTSSNLQRRRANL